MCIENQPAFVQVELPANQNELQVPQITGTSQKIPGLSYRFVTFCPDVANIWTLDTRAKCAGTVPRGGFPSTSSPSQLHFVQQLSQGESLWQNYEVDRTAKASHFGRGGIALAMTERARPLADER